MWYRMTKKLFFIAVLCIVFPGDSSELPVLLLMSLLGLPTLLLPLKSFRLMELNTFHLFLCAECGHGSFWYDGLVLANSQMPIQSLPHSWPQRSLCSTGRSLSNCHGENRLNLGKKLFTWAKFILFIGN